MEAGLCWAEGESAWLMKGCVGMPPNFTPLPDKLQVATTRDCTWATMQRHLGYQNVWQMHMRREPSPPSSLGLLRSSKELREEFILLCPSPLCSGGWKRELPGSRCQTLQVQSLGCFLRSQVCSTAPPTVSKVRKLWRANVCVRALQIETFRGNKLPSHSACTETPM